MFFFASVRRYGFLGSVYLLRCWILTRIFYSPARLIRFPFDCRNSKMIKFGKGFTSGRNCRIEVESESDRNSILLEIGENVQINDNVHITASQSIKIGNNVLIASKVYISDCSHGNYTGENQSDYNEIPSERKIISSPVIIEDNVWLGDGVCVLPGVKIGFGAIVGANSVVTKDISPKTISVGIPAKVIKVYNELNNKWERVK